MMHFFRVFFLIVSLLLVGVSYADSVKANQAFLKHCNSAGVKAKGNELIFNSITQNTSGEWVYILHNKTKKTIYMNHPADHPGTASAGWSSRLDAGQWSALLLNKTNFAITCQNSLMNNAQAIVACKKALKICRFKPHNNKQASYWVGENQPLNKLIKTLNVRSIY